MIIKIIKEQFLIIYKNKIVYNLKIQIHFLIEIKNNKIMIKNCFNKMKLFLNYLMIKII